MEENKTANNPEQPERSVNPYSAKAVAATSVIIFILCSISAIVYLYTNMKEQAWEEN